MNLLKRVWPLILITLAMFAQTASSGTEVNPTQINISVSNAPKIAVFQVSATLPNSFNLPTGTTVCIVTRNIAQSPGVDYDITAGAVVFRVAPQAGDIVQLNCW